MVRVLPRRTRSGDGSGMLTLSELSGSVGRDGGEADLLVLREDHPASQSVLREMTKSNECVCDYAGGRVLLCHVGFPGSLTTPFPERCSSRPLVSEPQGRTYGASKGLPKRAGETSESRLPLCFSMWGALGDAKPLDKQDPSFWSDSLAQTFWKKLSWGRKKFHTTCAPLEVFCFGLHPNFAEGQVIFLCRWRIRDLTGEASAETRHSSLQRGRRGVSGGR